MVDAGAGRAKVHVVVLGGSLPLNVVVGSGDGHDGRCFIEVMENIRVKHGVGRPRSRLGGVHADSAYDTRR